MTEEEKTRTLDAYNRYAVTMKTVGWPADTHEEWFAKHGNTPVEPVTDLPPEWDGTKRARDGHEYAHQPRATRGLRNRVKMLLASGMAREEIAALTKVPLAQIDEYADDAAHLDNGERRVADDHATLHEKRARKLARARESGRHAPPRKLVEDAVTSAEQGERTRRRLGREE